MDDQSAQATALEQRVNRVLNGTAAFKAPPDLHLQVLARIERGAQVPWWRRRVPEWPRPAQLLFGLTGVATAAALVLLRPARHATLGTVLPHPAVLQRPAADLHTTLNLLAAFDRLLDALVGSLSNGVWYGALALCAAGYVGLFFLFALGYRLIQTPAAR